MRSRYWSGLVVLFAVGVFAQAPPPATAPAKPRIAREVPEDHRPPLFLREDWKHVPANTPEHPVVQESITTPGIELKIYGENKQGIGPDTGVWEIQRASPKDDPTFIYTGPCRVPCALALRHRDNYMDLTGLAKIRWRTKQTGFHMLRPIVKLADGTWLVGDYAEGPSVDWRETEFCFCDVRWHYLNIEKVVTTKTSDWVEKVDLSRVDEVGFTDLMPGAAADNGHGTSGASRVDWIEVYANAVPRSGGR
ncbi:MAG TPA: hypothetical protein VN841_06250 [Bryobacteraceae bacterium]|nr:hypothetical protein [Bryobacteraceae bacterium]